MIGFLLGMAVLISGYLLYYNSDSNPVSQPVPPAAKPKPATAKNRKGTGVSPGLQQAEAKRKTMSKPPFQKAKAVKMENPEDLATEQKVIDHPKDIEEIKRRIYDLDIEHVEDMVLLDEVVQTGNADTQPFWSGGWISVDDFKGEDNGFNLQPQEDGTFIFYPDEETARTYTFFESPKTYTYDAERKEFYWEEDYYGKTIIHKARFINDNVLATMLISGNKVTLDIYQKTPEQYE